MYAMVMKQRGKGLLSLSLSVCLIYIYIYISMNSYKGFMSYLLYTKVLLSRPISCIQWMWILSLDVGNDGCKRVNKQAKQNNKRKCSIPWNVGMCVGW